MDVTARLEEALRVIDAVKVPADLRPAALGCVFVALGAEGGSIPAPAGVRSGGAPSDVPEAMTGLATKLGLPAEVLEQVYVVEEGQIELVVPASRLDQAKSKATEQIALLVAAGRQASALDDSWTSVDHIRSMCEHYRRHDQGNFASTIKAMDEVFVIRGTGRDRKVKMSAPGWQRAKDLVVDFAVTD